MKHDRNFDLYVGSVVRIRDAQALRSATEPTTSDDEAVLVVCAANVAVPSIQVCYLIPSEHIYDLCYGIRVFSAADPPWAYVARLCLMSSSVLGVP